MHTIKPLDTTLLASLGAVGKPIITVEEHSVHGGLGEAVASYLFQKGFHVPFQMMGFPDEYTVTGSQTEIFDHYGLSGAGIQDVALNLLNR
jgi:transketolase